MSVAAMKVMRERDALRDALEVERAISDFWEGELRRAFQWRAPSRPELTWKRWSGEAGSPRKWEPNAVPHIAWWHAHRRVEAGR